MAQQTLNVLIAASESTPIVKIGGIADVVGSLPKALKHHAVDARIILPFYATIDQKKYPTKKLSSFEVTTGNGVEKVEIHQTTDGDKTTIYLLKNKTHLSQGDVYSWPGHKTSAFWEKQRFLFFAKAITIALEHLPFHPNVLHVNDWHTGMVPKLLHLQSQTQQTPAIPTLFTIHNLGYQGSWDAEEVQSFLALSEYDISQKDIVQGEINEILEGIQYSTHINTVSPTYAKEILTPEFGAGLHKYLRKRKKQLSGILNGIDTDRFNPTTNTNIFEQFSAESLDAKTTNKIKLQKQLGLNQEPTKPLLAVVSRLVEQKGIDWILACIPKLAKHNVQLVILGTGDSVLEKQLQHLNKEHSVWFKALIKFDTALAQKIYAGSDMLIIPSRYEPCGLTQMIAMRYGTIPVVRATGGLKDTVLPYTPRSQKATGFVFKQQNAQGLYAILKKAIRVYSQQPDRWKKLQLNGMAADFSWKKSAKLYKQLYQSISK